MPVTATDIYVYLDDGTDALVTACNGDPTIVDIDIYGPTYRDIFKAASPLQTAATMSAQAAGSGSSALAGTSSSWTSPVAVNQGVFIAGVAAIPDAIAADGGVDPDAVPPALTYNAQRLAGTTWTKAISDELAHEAPRQAQMKVSMMVFPTASGLSARFVAQQVVGFGFARRR